MLLSAKKLTDKFDVPVTTSRRASRTGRIPSQRFGSEYGFDLDTVREAMRLHGSPIRHGGRPARDRRREPPVRAADPPPPW